MAAIADLLTAYPLLCLALALLALLALRARTQGPRPKLPPGPFSLPLVGTLPFLGTDIREPLRRLSRTYGDIFTVYFGSRRVVVLNSYEAIKEAFVRQGNVLAGRPQDLFFVRDIQEGKGIVSSEREPWREQRKLSHTILRDLGVGSSFMEERIVSEAVHLRDLFAENAHTPWSPAYSIQAAVANVIYSVCFQHRREYRDPDFIEYIDGINQSFEVLSNAGALTVFPALRHLPGDPFGYKELMRNVRHTRQHVYAKNVREHHQTYQKGVVRDFIDAYLAAMYQEQEEGRPTNLCDHQLERLIGDLIGAGTETSTSTLRWGLVYMLRNPDVQTKVQAEIDDVIGKKTPSMRYRQSMPYTEACLHEIQRIGDIVPLGVPHSALEDMSLLGYDIPRDTMVISNLYSVHFDPDLWPDPYRFDPTRFLDAEGKLHRPETLIPFSMGKRVCLGESLARMELFLFFVIMLQNFRFELPEGDPLPEQTGVVGVTHMPKPFRVVLVPRA